MGPHDVLPPSSSGPGRRPLKAVTAVQIRSGVRHTMTHRSTGASWLAPRPGGSSPLVPNVHLLRNLRFTSAMPSVHGRCLASLLHAHPTPEHSAGETSCAFAQTGVPSRPPPHSPSSP